VLKSFRQKFRNWAFRRTVETGMVVLNQRRIYILPTRQGIGFALLLVLMLLGDINYNLSLGYTLTFLLATAGGMSMLHAFRNMAQLEIHAGYVEPVFVGENAQFVFHFNNPSSLARYQLQLHDDAEHRTIFDLPSQQATAVQIAIPAKQRGWLDSGRLSLYTEYPFGLFHAWTYIHFDVHQRRHSPASLHKMAKVKQFPVGTRIFPAYEIMSRETPCRASHGKHSHASKRYRLSNFPPRKDNHFA